MDVLKQQQADVMMILSAVCGMMSMLVFLTNVMTKRRKHALFLMEFSAMLLLISDRRAYIYRGDTSTLGWWMVRISNFLVFFLVLFVLYGFNLYLIDLFTHEGGLKTVPRRLKSVKIMILLGMALVILAQPTGMYYTFDEMNRYQRAPGFIICYLTPLTVMFLQGSVIVQYRKRLSRGMSTALLLFSGFSIIASIFQVFMYGISLNNITIVSMSALLYIFSLLDMDREVEHARNLEIEFYKEEKKKIHAMFEQTAEALVTAIDAKDKYTHGHSTRVAIYASQIAREAGKSDEECEKVYFAALLHDVGKIGIPDYIINKESRLTDEEYEQIKLHPVYGNQILSNIQQSPYVSLGAHYHHEHYDGSGYPEGLKGDDIPEIARIIAVADAYDTMSSKRSYRDPLPQDKVREQLVEGSGTQFDPVYTKIMMHLIDLDTEYQMQEHSSEKTEGFPARIHCESICHDCSTGIRINEKRSRIFFYSRPDEGFRNTDCLPTLVLFDALDGRVHEDERKKKDMCYFEYGQIRTDGRTICEGARKMESRKLPPDTDVWIAPDMRYISCVIDAVRIRDHMRVRLSDRSRILECIIALPDCSRYSYISLTGEHCQISNIRVEQDSYVSDEHEIPRIAEEVSFIRGCPEGDIPNLQIDGWRSSATKGIPIREKMALSFHAQSLPTARLVWHCPYLCLFTSEDGAVNGPGFREYQLIRLDGETWGSDSGAENDVQIDRTISFPGWNTWKEMNRQGIDCQVKIRKEGSQILVETENLGIMIKSRTKVSEDGRLYLALTGDQCALTNIMVCPE
ncbi:MAG: HD domain-containing protein [Clostridia bacterium]|nr:HD domain-containing protein [Clostridia bacterium]